MERLRLLRERLARLGVRRWGREILLAVLLTIAAAGFIAAALLGRGSGSENDSAYETATKPPQR
jgi:hypothetical protein